MKKIISSVLVLVGLMLGSQAYAHVSYRDLDLVNPLNRTVTSNSGWIDAADENWGDSHHGAWYKFSLAQDSLVSIQVTGLNSGTYQTVNAAGTTFSDFTVNLDLTDVAFTLYKGLFPAGAYDSAAALPIPEGKDGRWDALGDTTMANNGGDIGTAVFVAAVNSSLSNTETLLNIFLTAGDYSIGAGGAILGELANNSTYGIQAQLLSVQPVPVPAAVWLMGSALVGLIGMRKQRATAA